MLSGPQPTPPPRPHIQILSPANRSTVNATAGFSVHGVAGGLFENNVVVRVRDGENRTLRQVVTTARTDGTWSVFITMRAANGTPGNLYAFSTSPADGSVVAEDAVSVTFASSCTPRSGWPIYVVQRGDTLFSIAQSTGSTVGELSVANCLPNPNLIVVGQELRVPQLPADEVVTVAPMVAIAGPGAFELLSTGTPVVVDGEAAGVAEGNILVRALAVQGHVLADGLRVLVLDGANRIVLSLPADVDVESGFWSVSLAGPLSIQRNQPMTVHALATSGSGEVLAADVVAVQVTQPTVTGDITYLPRSALPPNAVVTVNIHNLSLADAPPEMTLLGEQVIVEAGQAPIRFAVPYNPARVDSRFLYGIGARIEDGRDNLLFVSQQVTPVLTQGNPSKNVEVLVEPVP